MCGEHERLLMLGIIAPVMLNLSGRGIVGPPLAGRCDQIGTAGRRSSLLNSGSGITIFVRHPRLRVVARRLASPRRFVHGNNQRASPPSGVPPDEGGGGPRSRTYVARANVRGP
jgi:hypothetical protein